MQIHHDPSICHAPVYCRWVAQKAVYTNKATMRIENFQDTRASSSWSSASKAASSS